ncbi:PREDICTED: protein PET117 homolog, mitochondrial [Ceratosolen solmsi marchali]|uniref:Protein PET117 homolog, mitochondrial n=1 Tax=Ceratosolen solmsi marchali TaxID=326594 RepID=A0AAJ6YL39_9HYME|nr:PREDICTED: protein PET117 homolog, mitochondrial [Ceratosolen solmsi marchali]
MSITSKMVLITSTIASLGLIIYIHYKQEFDRKKLSLGIMKDLDKQRRRKIENIYLFDQQQKITKDLENNIKNIANIDKKM